MSMSRNKHTIIGATKGQQPIVDMNGVVIGEDKNADTMRMEYWVAKQLGEAIMAKFQNRQWSVDVDIENQVIVISCPSLSKRMGYKLLFKNRTVKQLVVESMRAAGEILERYGVSRDRIVDPMSLEGFDRDVRDDVKPVGRAKDAAIGI